MPKTNAIWGWLVFFLSTCAYIPINVGAWHHPIELNIASFSIWSIIACLITYSAVKLSMPGWKMMLGWIIGNISTVAFGLIQGGFTFNLGPTETIAFYGIITTLAIWAAHGTITKKWSPRILFFGSMTADILSFYPQIKQYITPHEQPTYWMLAGWSMWSLASLVNIVCVERLFRNLVDKPKQKWLTIEASAMSIENLILMIITIAIMYR